jgi:sodium pump decarboxylase gamma subunit
MLMTWSDVWAVVLTGLIVVFTGLLLLVFFVWLFGKIVGGISKKPPQSGSSQGGSPQTPAAPKTPSKTGGISGDVIAAISAAVTAFAGEGAVITSIKRAKPKMRTKSLEWNKPRFSGAEVIENGRWLR